MTHTPAPNGQDHDPDHDSTRCVDLEGDQLAAALILGWTVGSHARLTPQQERTLSRLEAWRAEHPKDVPARMNGAAA